MTDGLIDPDAFVCRAEGLDPDAVEQAGAEIWGIGTNITTKVHAVDGVWQGLRGVYISPDAETVYGVMKRALTPAIAIRTALVNAGKAIDTFAETLREAKPVLEQVEQEARTFRAEALEGYLEEVGNHFDFRNPADFDPSVLAAMDLGEGPRRWQKTHWRRHQHAVDTNAALLSRYNQVFQQVMDAAVACENTIRGLSSHDVVCLAPSPGLDPGFQQWGDYPWGQPVERRTVNAWDAFWTGTRNVGEDVVFGTISYVGLDENLEFSWDRMRNTWVETVQFWGNTAEVAVGSVGLFITGDTPDEGFREKQNKAFTQWGAMVNWDHQEHLAGGDGWHAYSEDGVKAWTETLLGLGAGGLAGRTLLRRGRHSRVLPKGVRTGLTHLHNATTALSQPWTRFRQGVRQFALDHVVNPLDDKLRVLAEQARKGLEEVADPWRNTALAGAGGPGGRGGSGLWDDPHTALSRIDDAAGGGRGGGHDVLDADPAPRRADPGLPEGDLPGTEVPEVEPPRRTDRYGNELIVDDHGQPMVQERHDGRLHYASDPEGTFRDNQGVLHHWLDGKFVEDPYKIPGYIAEHASWEIPPHDYPLPDADITPEWQTLRENARTARAAAADSVKFAEHWITDADSKSYRTLAKDLGDKKDELNLTDAQLTEFERHQELLEDAHKAEKALQNGSEWAGDRGGHLLLEDQGHQVIVGATGSSPGAHASPGTGAFDQVGISGPGIEAPGGKHADGDRYVMTFQENKGGNSPQLGSRNSAQQGTLTYLHDLVTNNTDPRLGDTLRQLRDQGRHPGFFEALSRGEVVVRYQYANTRTNGSLRTGLFNLGTEVRIRWDGTTIELLPIKEPS